MNNTFLHFLSAMLFAVYATNLIAQDASYDAALDVRFLLVSKNKNTISANISGVVSAMRYREGESFKKGSELIKLSCGVLKAERDKKKVELKIAKEEHESQKQLRELKSGSTIDFNLSALNIELAQSELAIVSKSLSFCTIKAPYSGVVSQTFVNKFEYIEKGKPLLETVDNSTLEVHMNVPSDWVKKINKGDAITVIVDETSKTYKAVISRIGHVVDPSSKTLKVIALLSNNKGLLDGMSGSARFEFGIE